MIKVGVGGITPPVKVARIKFIARRVKVLTSGQRPNLDSRVAITQKVSALVDPNLKNRPHCKEILRTKIAATI